LWKHFTLAGLVWRYGRLRRQLKRDPDARNYSDLALTPVGDDDSEEMFVTSAHSHTHAKPALVARTAEMDATAGAEVVASRNRAPCNEPNTVAAEGPRRRGNLVTTVTNALSILSHW